jgi:predicted P-loop ATPase
MDGPDHVDLACEVERLHHLSELEFEVCAEIEAQRLNVKPATLKRAVADARKRAAKAAKDRADIERAARVAQAAAESVRNAPLAEWQRDLQQDDRGTALPILANAAATLRTAPALSGMLAYDMVQRSVVMTRSLPGTRIEKVVEKRAIRDVDVSEIQEWMQCNGIARISREVVQQACDLVAMEHAFHPIRDYLDSLKWDGTPRIDTWLSKYAGVKNSEYVRKIGRFFLLSMVARVMHPGCKCDYALVFEGTQGLEKSTLFATLAGEWFSDSLPELHGGDPVRISMHLRGKWLIEFSELSAISKSEAGALKSFITRTSERYTPKHGRNEVTEHRECVFVASTNDTTYLRDPTGNRRFWPVRAVKIDIEYLKADRDQLFAEATLAMKAGEQYWPDREFEKKYIRPEQEARYADDEWEELIAQWLKDKVDVTVPDIAGLALGLDTAKLGTQEQRRITSALGRLKWRSARDKKRRWWEPIPPDEAEASDDGHDCNDSW